MPDIATALKTAIENLGKEYDKEKEVQAHQQQVELHKLANEWAADDPTEAHERKKATMFKPTNNTTRETFNCVRDNPGRKQSEIARIMSKRGFNAGSVATLMVQMVKVNIMRRTPEGLYFVNQPEYTPIKPSILKRARKATVTKVKTPSKAQGLAALPTPVPAPVAPRPAYVPPAETQFTINTFDADKLLSTLSFTQTIELYKKLKAMLGDLQ